jgi:hypothetical protein
MRFRIRDVDHSQVTARLCLTDRDSRTLPAGAIFDRFRENFFDFILVNIVLVNVRFVRARVDVIPKPHTGYSTANDPILNARALLSPPRQPIARDRRTPGGTRQLVSNNIHDVSRQDQVVYVQFRQGKAELWRADLQ